MKNKKIALLPTAYFPNTFYFSSMLAFDEIVFEKHETFPKQTYRNRMNILGPNGKQSLSVPVKKPQGHRTQTKDIQIENHQRWPLTHWRSIQTAYNNSPYFLFYEAKIRELICSQSKYLIDLNTKIIIAIFDVLKQKPPVFSFTNVFEKQPENIHDFRNIFKSKEVIQPANSIMRYHQVFDSKFGFTANLSILDLIFNMGPDALGLLEKTD